MKFSKTTISLVAITATASIIAAFSLREYNEPTNVDEPITDSTAGTIGPVQPRYRTSEYMLTDQEKDLLDELQKIYDPEELEGIFNPPTHMEWIQASRENLNQSFDPIAFASRGYEMDWSKFLDGLGLNEEDTRLVRDAWIEFEAKTTDLYNVVIEGANEPEEIIPSLANIENQLLARLSSILSSEQMTTFQEHKEQVSTNFRTQIQANYQEMANDGVTGIIAVAVNNDLPSVQAYLSSGADPNQMTESGSSAIRHAAAYNNTEMIQALINAGADVNLRIPEGWSPLDDAASRGHTAAVRLLVESGAELEYYSNANPMGTALGKSAMSGNVDTVRVLLEAGADATGIAGEFALAQAILFNNHEMEQMLIEAGANADAQRVIATRNFISLGRRAGLVND